MALDTDGAADAEIFKMTLADETIALVPLRNWGQLDIHKWVPRGKLPASPPGLEVSPDHVKIAGETVSIKDPDGCAKLERAFAEWLALERETLQLLRKKADAKPAAPAHDVSLEAPQPLHYLVEVNQSGQVHIRCVQGKETLASIGLNVAGFKSLSSQGLMRKPHTLQVGAMHDWVDLDGMVCSFEKGANEAAKLEKLLNERYAPATGLDQGKDVVIFANPASSTGFDIQFPAMIGGARGSHRHALNEDSLELLQDPVKCGLLNKGVVIKLTRPMLVFKQKTPDGGERYFDASPDNLVHITDEDGNETSIDLSKPVNYLSMGTSELTAVFNHPAIHKHGKATPRPAGAGAEPAKPLPAFVPPATASAVPAIPVPPPPLPPEPAPPPPIPPVQVTAPLPPCSEESKASESPTQTTEPGPIASPPAPPKPSPNAWLRPALSAPPIRHDWLACLLYSELAQSLGNSSEGKLGLSRCWATATGDIQDVSDPQFKGFFLTEKGGFGFVNEGHIARFNKGVVFIGTQETAAEGIGVNLIAVGFDAEMRSVFIVDDNYLSKFDAAAQLISRELAKLKEFGAVLLSAREGLESSEALEVLWTVPAQQEDMQNPKAFEWRSSAEPSATSEESL